MLKRARMTRYPAEILTGANYADNLVLLPNTPNVTCIV